MSLFSDKHRKKCNFCFLYRKKSVLDRRPERPKADSLRQRRRSWEHIDIALKGDVTTLQNRCNGQN